jgi:hypothetical protein
MVSSQRTVETMNPTYHNRQKSGALTSTIRLKDAFLTLFLLRD